MRTADGWSARTARLAGGLGVPCGQVGGDGVVEVEEAAVPLGFDGGGGDVGMRRGQCVGIACQPGGGRHRLAGGSAEPEPLSAKRDDAERAVVEQPVVLAA